MNRRTTIPHVVWAKLTPAQCDLYGRALNRRRYAASLRGYMPLKQWHARMLWESSFVNQLAEAAHHQRTKDA